MRSFARNLNSTERRVPKLTLAVLILVSHCAARADPPAPVAVAPYRTQPPAGAPSDSSPPWLHIQRPIRTITITTRAGTPNDGPQAVLPGPATGTFEQPATGVAPPSSSTHIHMSKVRTQQPDDVLRTRERTSSPDRNGVRTFRVPAPSMPEGFIEGNKTR